MDVSKQHYPNGAFGRQVVSKPVCCPSPSLTHPPLPIPHLPIPIRPPGLNANFLVEDEDALKAKYGGAFTKDRYRL